jgi:hypothetical protein
MSAMLEHEVRRVVAMKFYDEWRIGNGSEYAYVTTDQDNIVVAASESASEFIGTPLSEILGAWAGPDLCVIKFQHTDLDVD